MKKIGIITILTLFITGCATVKGWFVPESSSSVVEVVSSVNPTGSLTVLSAVGGICLLSGMALLVFSKGTMGWRPVIGGLILVLLNYVVANYAAWIFIPVIIATGAISSAWGWKVMEKILKHKENL